MWPELREELDLELAMLREHLGAVASLMEKSAASPPDVVETLALGAFLHGFYNGIENVLKRIALHMDGGLPGGHAWHQELLAGMARPGPRRPAVISQSLAEGLQEYLDFRHVFRHVYGHRLEWQRMARLVHGCRDILCRLERELALFLETTGGAQ